MVVLRRLSPAAVLVSIATTELSAQDLYVRDARALDPATQEVREGNLYIRGDTIVAWTASPPANFSGRIIEAAGKWIVPVPRRLAHRGYPKHRTYSSHHSPR